MKVITRQQLANQVAEQWEASAFYSPPVAAWKLEKLESLKALGPNPNPDDVDHIIGNKYWTETECCECGTINVPVVRFEASSYDADLCAECLKKALKMITGV